MSTNREFQRTDDEIVNLLSQWLMRTLGNDELRKRIEEIGTAELAPGQRAAVEELLDGARGRVPRRDAAGSRWSSARRSRRSPTANSPGG